MSTQPTRDEIVEAIQTVAERAMDVLLGVKSIRQDFALIGLDPNGLRHANIIDLFEAFQRAAESTKDKRKRHTAIVRILGDDLGRRYIATGGQWTVPTLEAAQ